MPVDLSPAAYLQALTREHKSYVAQGRTARAADVAAEIARVTGKPPVEKAAKKAPETAGGSDPQA